MTLKRNTKDKAVCRRHKTCQRKRGRFTALESQKSAGKAEFEAIEAARAALAVQEQVESGQLRGEDGVTLRIDSSRGTVFKNSSMNTVLSATVYTGGLRITDIAALRDRFGITAHLQWRWQKLEEVEYGLILPTDPMVGSDGFTLTIDADAVDEKCTFMCELVI